MNISAWQIYLFYNWHVFTHSWRVLIEHNARNVWLSCWHVDANQLKSRVLWSCADEVCVQPPVDEVVVFPAVAQLQDKLLPEVCDSRQATVAVVDHAETQRQAVGQTVTGRRLQLEEQVLRRGRKQKMTCLFKGTASSQMKHLQWLLIN